MFGEHFLVRAMNRQEMALYANPIGKQCYFHRRNNGMTAAAATKSGEGRIVDHDEIAVSPSINLHYGCCFHCTEMY